MLLEHALKGAKQEGADVELYAVAGKRFEPCDACRTCDTAGSCHIDDDVKDILARMLAADGIIFGTPVYSYSMTPQLKTIIDRTVSLKRPWGSLNNKVGGAIVTGGSLGLADTLKDLYFWIITRQMLPANFVAAYCLEKGEVQSLEKCFQATFALGRQMALLAAKKFEYPPEIDSAKHGYGTWVK
jgi:multimeric flavodoxin WrbA